ncbi:MAG: radical SAM protein [Nitrosomonas sp.]|uniref:radical SAM protein n=1 Tax=Nitrosomonas sp. TaxID=42353 RepID=UPI002749FF6B|nr:radical SAM protein [Nitrosomonas sp.]MDP3184557.1 radical SAM protein [Anaerolineales bacterium]MDP3609343.1 radical SAM protein [Methylophilus sp.]MDZ4106380.1 radical SAM protein [Nitrosomonas sp.]
MIVQKLTLPTEAIISVTNRCDARCSMCNIWQLEPQEYLSAEDYHRNLPKTLRNVNLTGGEALLRPDIVEVTQAIYEASGQPRIILATNGFRTAKTVQTVKRILQLVPTLGIAVSLDGSEEQHDRMRGVPRAYARATETIRALQSLGLRDIRIGFTATKENVEHLVSTYEYAKSLNVEFTATVAQNSEIYYSTVENAAIDPEAIEREFGRLIEERLHSRSPKDWIRSYFDSGVIHFAKTGARMTGCDAAAGFFYLAPSGDIYPCLTVPSSLGNIRTQSFTDLWTSYRAALIRQEASRCQKCWMMCTSRTEIKRNPLRAARWLLREQGKFIFKGRTHSLTPSSSKQPPTL